MKSVDLYAQVRFAVQIEGVSRRAAARRFGIDPRTVAKMLAFSVPPGYRRRRPPTRPKLDPFIGIIEAILAADEGRPKKQRHTAKRIFAQLGDLALRDTAEPHCLHQLVDPPGRDAADPSLLDHRNQRLLGSLARLEKRREVRSLAQL